MHTQNSKIVQALRALSDSSAIEKILEKSAPQRPLAPVDKALTHTDARRKAYHHDDFLRLSHERVEVGHFTDEPDRVVIFNEGWGDEDEREGFVVDSIHEGWCAYERASDLYIRGIGHTPLQAIAHADLNMINERALDEGRRAPYRGQEFVWVVADLDERDEIEVAIIPIHMADSQERARDIAELPNGATHPVLLHVVETEYGELKAFTTIDRAASYLMDKVGSPF